MKPVLFVAAIMAAMLLVTCQADSTKVVEVPLVITIEPCAPFEDLDVEPCDDRDPRMNLGEGSGKHDFSKGRPDTVAEIISNFNNQPGNRLGTPLFVVRGRFVPNSAKCKILPFVLSEDYMRDEGWDVEKLRRSAPESIAKIFECAAEFDVSEYIVGSGSNRIPIKIDHYSSDYPVHRDVSELTRRLNEERVGREFILGLRRPSNVMFPAWYTLGGDYWEVQTRDGIIVAVHSGEHHWPRPTSDHRAHIVYDLDEFRRQMIAAFNAHPDRQGGSRAAETPRMPSTANSDTLRVVAEAHGAVDFEHLGIITLYEAIDTPTPTPVP